MFLKVQNAFTISIHVWPVFVLLQILKKKHSLLIFKWKIINIKMFNIFSLQTKITADLPMFGRPIPDTLSKQKKKKPPQLKHPFPDVMKKTFSYRVFA